MGYMDSAGGRPGQAPDRVVYLDHAATTPLLPEALSAMTEELGQLGNPSSLHNAGRRARRVVEESREQVAEVFGARPSEVIFTGGGTEADNLAVKGLYWARQGGAANPGGRPPAPLPRGTTPGTPGPRDRSLGGDGDTPSARPSSPANGPGKRRRVLTTAVEHHAVLDSVHWLTEHEGAQQALLPVDRAGTLRPGTLADAIDTSPGTVALVTVMWANNEVGTVQPIAELAEIAREHGIPFHTDAVQAAGQLPVSFAASGADAMTVTAHKFGGPVGAGALLLARGVQPVPVLHGGGQESEVRSGTLDAPAIRAFAVAAAVMAERREEEAVRLAGLRDDLIRQVMAEVPDAILNGPPTGPGRLPGNAHFSFPGCEGDALLMLLDAKGIACSTGSACTAGVAQPSHVLLAMGADEARARGSLRFSLGHTTTQQDVDALGAVLGEVVQRARRAAGN